MQLVIEVLVEISVLGIGSELTSGQIPNRNAQWISARLKDFGVSTSLHLVVPDDQKLIVESLKFAKENSDVLFVTGGLGPTSDDFTRVVIAEWTGKKLVYDEASWKHIEDRLNSRGVAVKEIQRQQCYFPEGSKILMNSNGTANGFSLTQGELKIYVLPGPPKEIEAIWKDHIEAELCELTKNVDALTTLSWDTMGLGESDIATLTEQSLEGSSFEKGYRVHMPFVEVKLTFKKSQHAEAKKYIDQIEKNLKPYTVLRNGDDATKLLAEKIRNFSSITVIDEVTQGFLLSRLSPRTKDLSINFLSENRPCVSDLVLQISKISEFEAEASIFFDGKSFSERFSAPIQKQTMIERARQYIAEKSLLFWMQNL